MAAVCLIKISIHKPLHTDNCGGGLTIEPNTIVEKHAEKGHVTYVESNGSADVNKPDSGDRNNTKCAQKNIVAASFSYENHKGSFTKSNIHLIRTASSKK